MNKKFIGLFLVALIMLSSHAFSALKIDDVDEENLLPIHLVAREGNIEELKKLMEKYGHHIDEEDAGTEERTPLHLAAHHGHADCVAWLLKEAHILTKKMLTAGQLFITPLMATTKHASTFYSIIMRTQQSVITQDKKLKL